MKKNKEPNLEIFVVLWAAIQLGQEKRQGWFELFAIGQGCIRHGQGCSTLSK